MADKTDTPAFAIVTDSSCDLSPETLARLGVTLVSGRITIKGDEYLDRRITREERDEIFAHWGSVRVTAPGRDSYAAAFEDLVDEGASEVVVAVPSTQLSDSYNSALEAAHRVRGARFKIIDTRCVSVSLAMVVARLVMDRDAGLSVEEAVSNAAKVAEESRLLMLLPPQIEPGAAHLLGNSRGLRRSLRALGFRVSGDYVFTEIDETGDVNILRRSSDFDWLAGNLARTMSVRAHEAGPLTTIEVWTARDDTLSRLEKPLVTNEFVAERAAVVRARFTTEAALGSGTVGVAFVPQSLLDPYELRELLAE